MKIVALAIVGVVLLAIALGSMFGGGTSAADASVATAHAEARYRACMSHASFVAGSKSALDGHTIGLYEASAACR